LLNHAAILSVLEKELARSARDGNPVSVMMADIDYFKGVNDTYGHPSGDAVLRETAQRMLASVRPYDSIGRYGGEEFVVVAPGCDVDGAVKLAERMRGFVCAQPVRAAEATIPTTMSIGVAVSWDDAQSAQLLQAADEALYAAKGGGRNRVAAFSHAKLDTMLGGGRAVR
jgi:two-component system, cell cycle response regulator